MAISLIKSYRNSFNKSTISIASKDESEVEILTNKFNQSELYDVIAFRKKNFYKTGGYIKILDKIEVENIKLKSDFFSTIIINNDRLKNTNLDLDKLY